MCCLDDVFYVDLQRFLFNNTKIEIDLVCMDDAQRLNWLKCCGSSPH